MSEAKSCLSVASGVNNSSPAKVRKVRTLPPPSGIYILSQNDDNETCSYAEPGSVHDDAQMIRLHLDMDRMKVTIHDLHNRIDMMQKNQNLCITCTVQ